MVSRAGLPSDDNTHSESIHLEPPLSRYFRDPYDSQSVPLESFLSQCIHDTRDSVSARTSDVMLSEDPVLRLYAVDMFVHHVAAADRANADPSELMEMLHSDVESRFTSACWNKWCQLSGNYDQRLNVTPAYFAASWNLKTWIEWYTTSLSHRNMLKGRSGGMRYPLLAALLWDHRSIVACLSDNIDAEIPGKDAWALLYLLAVDSIRADTTLERRQLNYGVTELLMSMSLGVLLSLPTEANDSYRFRRYMKKSSLDILSFKNMLVRIQTLSSNIGLSSKLEPWQENEARSFLDSVFLRLGC